MSEQPASKVPKIRFKGFNDGWLEDLLGERVEFFSGLTYSPRNVQKGVGTFVLRSSNVKNGEIVNADNVYVDPKIVNSKNIEVGDIVVVVRNGSRSLIGKHAQIKNRMDNTVIGAFMTGIHSENPAFTNALLDTPQFDKEIAKNLGATINQITTGAFKQMMFRFPGRTEQTQIGGYFRELDRLIGLHQHKHDKLVSLKKSMLQKMFPQPGAAIPEIRFKGFSGNWVEKKLWELCQEFHSGKFISASEIAGTGQYPVYGGNGLRGYSEKYNHDGLYALIGRQGALCGNMNLFTGRAFFTEHAIAVQADKDNDTVFLFYLFGKMNLGQYSSQSAQPGLAVNKLQNLSSLICEKSEQIQIGTYFRTLDELISQHAIQLQKLKQIKAACLEKMFV